MFFNNEAVAFRIRGVFRVHAEPQMLVERNREHSALSLRICGKSTFASAGEQLQATDGTLMYFPSGVDYTRRTRAEEELIAVHLECFGEEEKRLEKMDCCEHLIPHFEELERVWRREGYSGAMEILYRIFRILDTQSTSVERTPALIELAARYMRQHAHRTDFRVSNMAEHLHVSEPYLRRIWKGAFGKSPMESLLDERFSLAEKMLLSGYYSTKEASALAGFSDVKYFRTAFSKRYGIPVGVYVRSRKKQPNPKEFASKTPAL